MATVQFEDENNQAHYTSRSILGQPVQPKMISVLLKVGIKNEKQAGYVLFAITLIAFALAAYIFFIVLPENVAPDVVENMP